MHRSPKLASIRTIMMLTASIFFVFSSAPGKAQMRKVYAELSGDNNTIKKMSFYSPSEGYIASTTNTFPWIGYTSDSGKTFTKKTILLNNVDVGFNPVNILFPFDIRGIKAFNQNKILVYGGFGAEPSILYSTDAGNSFTLIYWSGFTGSVTNGITDIVFPENNAIGYAIDDNRILKTTNQGLNWSVIASYPGRIFSNLEAVDNNTVFALSTGTAGNGMIKTTNGGGAWQDVSLPALPARRLMYAHFITATTGWVDISDHVFGDSDGKFYFYKTTDGGNSWTMVNNAVTSFVTYKIKFTDINTGYAIGAGHLVYKTTNGGKIWEVLPRDTDIVPFHNDLQVISANQLWAGGYHDFLELSTNGGGTPLPASYFSVDTSGLAATGKVGLVNYSRTDYTYQWFVNNSLVSTAYNTSYTHNPDSVTDVISLIVSNGVTTDTSILYQDFYPRVRVNSFNPQTGGSGTLITINGTNLSGANTVSIGGVPAAAFTVVSPTVITATVSSGASGYIKVVTNTGRDSLAGFSFIQPPVISSFNPAAATAGTMVTITGNNFTSASTVSFAGIPAASFSVLSATTITAIAPSGRSGAITVSTAGGTMSLPGYIALPTLVSFTPNRGTQGSTININGASLSGVSAVTIGGENVLSFMVNSPNSITASVGAGNSGSAVVSKPGGSSSLPGYTWFTSPVIAAFSPAAGPAGTTVTITGTGFNSSAANNIVYFGAVRAGITAGNATSLTVTVPAGATYEPISVLNNNTNLSGFSARPFLLTYPGGNISGHTFETRASIQPDNIPMFVSLGDLDADGKTDLIVSAITRSGTDGEVLLYRNRSTIGATVFASPVIIPHTGFRQAIAADLDGDGKPDLAVLSSDPVATFLNTSVPGIISFTAGPVLEGGNQFNQNSMAVADADGDGKPDIITSNGMMYRNTSTPGIISFDKSATVFGVSRNVLLVDLSGDNKPELIFSDNDNTLYVLKNKCTKGTLAFEDPVAYTGFSHTYMVAGDMDGDGKTDLVSSDYYNFKIGIIRNTSSGNNISFDTAMVIPAPESPFGIAVGDIDGDGKPDIAATLQNYDLAAFRNTSAAGSISFSPQINFIPGTFYGNHIAAMGDLDGDGKNDAVTTISYTESMVSVHLNTFSTVPSIASFSPLSGKLGDTITIAGTNFTGTSAVSFGNTAAASFIVESATTIKAILGNGASGNVSVTTPSGTISVPGFTYLPSIASFAPATGGAGTVVTITGVSFTGATNVSFGGAAAISFTVISNNRITAIVSTGASGKVAVTNAAGTAVSAEDFTFISSLPPSITSVTPIAANKGATVTISGSNFSNSTTGNEVYFGTIKATVLTATSNTLTVVVPNGSVYEHIMVTKNFLTAISPKRFVTTFPGGTNFTATSFTAKQDVVSGIVQNFDDAHFKDIDGDKLLDIIAPSNDQGEGFNVMRNKGTVNGLVSYELPKHFTAPSIYNDNFFGNIAVADFDGDGKPDVAQFGLYTVLGIRRNISTATQILFDTAVIFNNAHFTSGGNTLSIAVSDINHDGKPDIIIRNPSGSNVMIYINNTVGASLNFDSPVEITFETNIVITVRAEDVDNDLLPDLIVTTFGGNDNKQSIFIARNTSSGNDISFAPAVVLESSPAYHLLIGDMDGDTKPDIVISDYLGVVVFRNTSTPGNISFTTAAQLTVYYSYFINIGMNDLNGDGKPDIALTQSNVDSVSVYQNTSTPGNISFSDRYSYFVGKSPDAIISGDVDGDGKPDVGVVIHEPPVPNQNVIAILRNLLGNTAEKEVCAGSNASLLSAVTGTTYQWQQNTGTGFANVLANNVISGANTAALQFSNIPVTYNGYQYTCITDGIAGSIVTLKVNAAAVAPTVSITTPAASVCTGAVVVFTATPSPGTVSPSYQWEVNGIAGGTNNPVFNSSSLANNSLVKCAMTSTSTGVCGTSVTVNSNTLTITINTVVPAIVVTGNTTVTKDSSAAISAAITNGGTTPVYKWQDSTSSHSWQDITGAGSAAINYKPASTGDKIRCILISNANCASPATINSNTLAFTVNTVTGISPVPGGPNVVRYYPNPATVSFTIDSLKISDQWQTIEIVSINGDRKLLPVNISNQTAVTIVVQQLPQGFYIAVLRRKEGAPVYLKFIKL